MADQENSLNITWSQFKDCNPYTQAAFENMCRFLFNAFFFDGKGFILILTIQALKLFQFFMKNQGSGSAFKPNTFALLLIIRKSSILLKKQFNTILMSWMLYIYIVTKT